jgi:hypothetical protein
MGAAIARSCEPQDTATCAMALRATPLLAPLSQRSACRHRPVVNDSAHDHSVLAYGGVPKRWDTSWKFSTGRRAPRTGRVTWVAGLTERNQAKVLKSQKWWDTCQISTHEDHLVSHVAMCSDWGLLAPSPFPPEDCWWRAPTDHRLTILLGSAGPHRRVGP